MPTRKQRATPIFKRGWIIFISILFLLAIAQAQTVSPSESLHATGNLEDTYRFHFSVGGDLRASTLQNVFYFSENRVTENHREVRDYYQLNLAKERVSPIFEISTDYVIKKWVDSPRGPGLYLCGTRLNDHTLVWFDTGRDTKQKMAAECEPSAVQMPNGDFWSFQYAFKGFATNVLYFAQALPLMENLRPLLETPAVTESFHVEPHFSISANERFVTVPSDDDSRVGSYVYDLNQQNWQFFRNASSQREPSVSTSDGKFLITAIADANAHQLKLALSDQAGSVVMSFSNPVGKTAYVLDALGTTDDRILIVSSEDQEYDEIVGRGHPSIDFFDSVSGKHLERIDGATILQRLANNRILVKSSSTGSFQIIDYSQTPAKITHKFQFTGVLESFRSLRARVVEGKNDNAEAVFIDWEGDTFVYVLK